MTHLSIRQQPVVSRLSVLIDEAKAVASAVLDNSIDESRPIPLETQQHLCKQFAEINSLIDRASHG
jgi:hypothetical protein